MKKLLSLLIGSVVLFGCDKTEDNNEVEKEYLKVTYDFDEWEKQQGSEGEQPYSKPIGFWATSNDGAHLAKMFSQMAEEKDAVEECTEGYHNSAAYINTINTKGVPMGPFSIPKVTAGTLFNGDFTVDLTNTLKSTKFGTAFEGNKPIQVTGFYKYSAGAVYYDSTRENPAEAVENKDKKDKGNITVVLYEIEDEKSEYLTGVNLHEKSEAIAYYGTLDLEDSKEFKPFTLAINEIKQFSPAKSYRLAIVASSSKDGDKFSGAPGSQLAIDDIILYMDKE